MRVRVRLPIVAMAVAGVLVAVACSRPRAQTLPEPPPLAAPQPPARVIPAPGPLTAADGSPGPLRLDFSAIPNPFAGSTSFRFTLPSRGPVELTIFDARGRMVRSLLSRSVGEPGAHQLRWDGVDDRGRMVSSGIYYPRLRVGNEERTVRVTRLR